MSRLAVEWVPIEPPQPPIAVLAEGASALGLAESATHRLAAGANLRAAVGGGTLLILGEPDALPWAPGATYLAREQRLLLPTTLAPTVPVDLLATAVTQLLARNGTSYRHVAVLPEGVITFDVADTPTDVAALRGHAVEEFA